MKSIIGLCFAVLLVAGTVHAQESAQPGTPSEVVKAAYDAMNTLDWEQYVSYAHPEALAEFKNMLWPIVQAKFGDSTADVSKIQLLLGVGRDAEGNLPDYPAADFMSNALLQITEAVPQLKQQLSRGKTTIIGEVGEGENLVHVVVRITYTNLGQSVSEVRVASVKESPDGWRVMLSAEMKTLAMGMAQMISQ
jgi:hypothetical protein